MNFPSKKIKLTMTKIKYFLITSNSKELYVYTDADSDYRNVQTCEPLKVLLVKNRGNVVKNREILRRLIFSLIRKQSSK